MWFKENIKSVLSNIDLLCPIQTDQRQNEEKTVDRICACMPGGILGSWSVINWFNQCKGCI